MNRPEHPEQPRRKAGPSVYEERARPAADEGWTPIGEFGPAGEFIPARPDPIRSPGGWTALDGLLRDRAT